jgi:hypothetical protein
MTGHYHKLGQGLTISHPVKFMNHPIFQCHITELLKASLNKPYTQQIQECVVTTLTIKLNQTTEGMRKQNYNHKRK